MVKRYSPATMRVMELEQRVLLDAAAVATAVDTLSTDTPMPDPVAAEAENSATEGFLSVSEYLSEPVNGLRQIGSDELIVIDSAIPDYESLVAQLPVNTQVLLIDTQEDGIQALADYLSGQQGFSAVHIFSHGSQGTLTLGSAELTQEALENYRHELSQIGEALGEQGELLLYGCDVAQGEAGISFVSDLSEFTGAAIQASDDVSGDLTQGGDWDLELKYGSVSTPALSFFNYSSTLGFDTATDHNNDSVADPVRMITWNVIGIDSNKPDVEGPNQFMVGVRVNADASGLSNLTVK